MGIALDCIVYDIDGRASSYEELGREGKARHIEPLALRCWIHETQSLRGTPYTLCRVHLSVAAYISCALSTHPS